VEDRGCVSCRAERLDSPVSEEELCVSDEKCRRRSQIDARLRRSSIRLLHDTHWGLEHQEEGWEGVMRQLSSMTRVFEQDCEFECAAPWRSDPKICVAQVPTSTPRTPEREHPLRTVRGWGDVAKRIGKMVFFELMRVSLLTLLHRFVIDNARYREPLDNVGPDGFKVVEMDKKIWLFNRVEIRYVKPIKRVHFSRISRGELKIDLRERAI
jgi:hypothetical protein